MSNVFGDNRQQVVNRLSATGAGGLGDLLGGLFGGGKRDLSRSARAVTLVTSERPSGERPWPGGPHL